MSTTKISICVCEPFKCLQVINSYAKQLTVRRVLCSILPTFITNTAIGIL